MREFASLHQFLVILISVLGVGLALWVYYANKGKKPNKLFLLLVISILAWVNLGYFSHLSETLEVSLFLKRSIFGVVSLFLISAYFFSIYFPKEKRNFCILNKVVVVVGIIFFSLSVFSDFFIKGVEYKKWGVDVVLGDWILIFYSFVAFITFFILFIFIDKYFSLSNIEKKKVQYFLLGVSIFAFFNFVFNILLPCLLDSFRYNFFGNYSAIFLLGFTAYAVVNKKLFGVKIILTDALIALVAIILFANIFVSVNWLEFAWNTMIFLIFSLFGFFLIRSTWRRMRAREQIQRYAKKLQRANKRLQKLDQQKTEFISFAAHQLRAPLTSVRGFASLVLDDSMGKTPPKVKDAMKNIFDSATSMINSVEDYLNITRIEQNRMEYDISTFDLYEVAQAVVNELQPNAYKKKIDLSISSDRNKSYNVKADQSKIKQVINNLVDNAIKYTQEGGVKVYLSHQRKRKMIRLSVSDSGMGMSRKTIKKLFQKYSRAQNTEDIQGTGLGLFIAKRMVEAQKGKVWAESDGEGKGSTFYVELPRSRK